MKTGAMRISKKTFYALGGFRNSYLFRKADARGVWQYFQRGP